MSCNYISLLALGRLNSHPSHQVSMVDGTLPQVPSSHPSLACQSKLNFFIAIRTLPIYGGGAKINLLKPSVVQSACPGISGVHNVIVISTHSRGELWFVNLLPRSDIGRHPLKTISNSHFLWHSAKSFDILNQHYTCCYVKQGSISRLSPSWHGLWVKDDGVGRHPARGSYEPNLESTFIDHQSVGKYLLSAT